MLYHKTISQVQKFPAAYWVVIVATLINQIGNMGIAFLMIYLTQHNAESIMHAASAFALFSASMLITGLFGGDLVDKLAAEKVMLASLLANGIILFFIPYVHSFSLVLVLCVLWGIAYGLYRPASQTFVSQLSPPGLSKITFSIYRLAINLGMSIGPALGGYLAYHAFNFIFFANAVANILAWSILFIGIKKYSTNKSADEERRLSLEKLELGIKWLKRDPALRLFVIGMIPVSMVFFQHESTLAVFLSDDLKFPLSFYGLLFTLNTLIIVCCELPLNIATLHWPYRWNFMLGSFFVTVGFAGLLIATQQWQVIVLAMLWTLGEMIFFPAASSYISEIAPSGKRGSYMAMYSTCSNLGMLFGPLAGAIIMQHTGPAGLWIACGLWGLLSVIVYYRLRK